MRRTRLASWIAAILALCTIACERENPGVPGNATKVLVLGFDGLDPELLETFVATGRLPHFRSLLGAGTYRRLGTTTPPQSPVAWSSFITGLDPGGHGIFDFVHRKAGPPGGPPLLPYLSTSEVEGGPGMELGSWRIPLGSGEARLLREGKAFWTMLDEAGVPATVVKIPANFPPEPSGARTLSDMGTPDLRGTYGTFTYVTTDRLELGNRAPSGGLVRRVALDQGVARFDLEGPANPFSSGGERTTVPVVVHVDDASRAARIEVSGEVVLLAEGEWSDWVPVAFPLVRGLASVSGILRFHLRTTAPDLRLYVSPVNIDPRDPMLPLSTPPDYVESLAKELGPFYTQGLPEDTAALTAGALDDGDFIAQADHVFHERARLFDLELARFREGLLYVYFGGADQVSHMFWRTLDLESPELTSHPVFRAYAALDGILGRALAAIDAGTILLVMSDHGFAPFRRAFHLNAWLRDAGYLRLRNGRRRSPELFADVDWSATRAYGLGLNGLYVNLAGREREGIVSPSDREALVAEIVARLLEVQDPETSERVVATVDRREDVYTGPHVGDAPDLVVGYARGHRVSNESALGSVAEVLIEPNRGSWSGDHCIAADLVPGVLLANRPLTASDPALIDLAPTILRALGVKPPRPMRGRDVFAGESP